jgi:hypothetical protein
MTRLMWTACAVLLAGCAPSLDDELELVESNGVDHTEQTARVAAEDALEEALLEVDIAPEGVWAELDPDEALLVAADEARRHGCSVAGYVGGAWADEDNRMRGAVHRFDRTPVARLGAYYKALSEDGGVWAGAWQGRGDAEGNLGGLFGDEHRFAGQWEGDGGGHGRMIGAWKRVDRRGGAFLGVWAVCR